MALADEFRQKMTFEIADATAGFTCTGRFVIANLLPAFDLAPFFWIRIAMSQPFLMFRRACGFLIFPTHPRRASPCRDHG